MDALSEQHPITEKHVTTRYGMIIGTIFAISIGISGAAVLVYKIKKANSTYSRQVAYQSNGNLIAIQQPADRNIIVFQQPRIDAEVNPVLPEVILD